VPQAEVKLGITLKLRHPQALRSLIAEQYDPKSPLFRHYLTVGQFATDFAPSEAQYASVEQYLQQFGFSVRSYPDRTWISAQGTFAGAERAFGVAISRYRMASGRAAFSATSMPTLPAQVGGLVAGIAGLNDVVQPHPAGIIRKSPPASGGEIPPRLREDGLPQGSAACSGGGVDWGPGASTEHLSPCGVAAAYDVGPLQAAGGNGTGVTVDILAAGYLNVSHLKAELGYFSQYFGLPAPVLDTSGGSGTPATLVNIKEAHLDTQWLHAVAPAATMNLEVTGPSPEGMQQGYADAVNKDYPVVLNTYNFGEPSNYVNSTFDNLFLEAAAQGMTLVSASGDYGAYTAGNEWNFPAIDPWVTTVGGTRLAQNGTSPTGVQAPQAISTATPEIGWEGSGGGVATGGYGAPSWQTNVAPTGGYRNVPDLAFLAAARPGGSLYWADKGGWAHTAYGTSLAATIFAGIVADTDSFANLGFAASPGADLGLTTPTLYRFYQYQQSQNNDPLPQPQVVRDIPYN
jgi:kumamolisin